MTFVGRGTSGARQGCLFGDARRRGGVHLLQLWGGVWGCGIVTARHGTIGTLERKG
ncbi:hypothetical protein FRAHR75_720024 [Frankia sp. Hr75.2]|nr:hypothetical protein FRAHR75_720024 [Frankia sp. Hr75.2]SQD94811.1 hypothetical protein FMEAI12_2780018 [Parafrankia sp. Ea1.12]